MLDVSGRVRHLPLGEKMSQDSPFLRSNTGPALFSNFVRSGQFCSVNWDIRATGGYCNWSAYGS